VFGDMLGLGESAAALHADVARLALELPIHRVYPVGELATAAFAALVDPRVRVVPREAVARELVGELGEEDDAVVLVKGSRGMRLEDLADEIVSLSPPPEA
jgi:UDP-N-acetylmuramyl pentapeptide synthase